MEGTSAGGRFCRPSCTLQMSMHGRPLRPRYLPIRNRTINLCQTCYKYDAASHRTCTRCGAIERLHHFEFCAPCAWPDAIGKFLSGPGCTVRPEIEPVLAALTAADARSGLNSAARARTQNMLAGLATGTGPVTHSLLDELTPVRSATYLRAILVEAAVLPARDELLIKLEQAVERRIARIEDQTERKILRSYAAPRHLRRLRKIADRRPPTQDQGGYAVDSLPAADRVAVCSSCSRPKALTGRRSG